MKKYSKVIYIIIVALAFFIGRDYSMEERLDLQERVNQLEYDYSKLNFETASWKNLSVDEQKRIMGNNFFASKGNYYVGEGEKEIRPGNYRLDLVNAPNSPTKGVIVINGENEEYCMISDSTCNTRGSYITLKTGDEVVVKQGSFNLFEER